MSQATYRNRRGNKVSIGEAIDDISKQNSKTEPNKAPHKPAHKSTKKDKVKKSTPIKRRKLPRLSKKLGLVIGLAVVLVAVMSLVAVDGYKRDYERMTSDMRRQVTQVSQSTFSEEAIGSESAAQLNSQLTITQDYCEINDPVVSWYHPAKKTKQRCQDVARQYNQLRDNLAAIEAESVYAEQVGEILRQPLKNPASGVFASLGEYDERWADAIAKLEKLAVPDRLSQPHKTMLDRVKALSKQWQALTVANAEQDAGSFTTAEKVLGESYQGLRGSQHDIIQPIIERQASINRLVDELIIKE